MGVQRPAIRFLPVVALLLVAGALWIWADRMLPKAEDAALQILEPQECDLNAGPCSARLRSGGAVEVGIAPVPVVGLQPLVLDIAFSDQDPAWLEVDLVGVEMFMGHHRPRLERVGPGAYRGEVTLPVCVSDRMTWAATVLPEGRLERAEFQFRFVSRR
jgi:hypothetical protein